MTRQNRHTAQGFACDSCGQLPHPAKGRLTLANIAAMLPIELVVHAAVVNTALPYVVKVLVLMVLKGRTSWRTVSPASKPTSSSAEVIRSQAAC
ncbi:hypothetical protein J2X01_000328 [Arthrobacter ginsengisoli]|uniref:Uncharacterized protein n=1 Tax=Arthrobacter ginsengisoli TaxID=1356565 RepID=A0ABU1U787_9MICC|nr:hypothetical protein [Arthrobacter ginsengisoli]MDR7081059.1 hypothetical protein [Arthrobacter ginsengisoli]